MGLAVDSLRDTLSFVSRSRGFLVLVLFFSVVYFVGDLFVSLFSPGSVVGVLLSLLVVFVVSFLLVCVVYCLLREGSLSGALAVLSRYLVNLVLAEILIFLTLLLLFVPFIVLFVVAYVILLAVWPIGVLLMVAVIVLGAVSYVYASTRLFLTSPSIVFNDLSALSSMRNSWAISKGKVSIIFSTVLAFSITFVALLVISELSGVLFKGVLYYPLLALNSVIRSIYTLSSPVLSVMLFKHVSGHMRK